VGRRSLVLALAAALALSLSSPTLARRPDYEATVTRIPKDIRSWMRGVSWRVGCPVPMSDLRLIRLLYWGFDREAHHGRLVVHRRVADEVARLFGRIYNVRFPIRRMRLVDRYGANDRESMEHDNTSAFNCRWRAGQPGVWSMHAYGKAIDVNPVENPYLQGARVRPPAGRRFLDRSRARPGMAVDGGVLVRAFESVGWKWGGRWSGSRDYQHFSTTGR
jgi:hypothetical protein